MRIRLLGDLSVSPPSSMNPIVAFTWSRSNDLPVSMSPERRQSTASSRSAYQNEGSRWSRSRTVTLKSLVNGIALTPPAFGVGSPVKPSGGLDVLLLPPLRASTERHDHRIAVAPEVDPVSRTGVDPVLEDSASDAFRARQDVPPHAVKRRRDLDCRLAVEHRRGEAANIQPPKGLIVPRTPCWCTRSLVRRQALQRRLRQRRALGLASVPRRS